MGKGSAEFAAIGGGSASASGSDDLKICTVLSWNRAFTENSEHSLLLPRCALPLLRAQIQHDFISKNGIIIAQENDLLSEYIVTFMLNKTTIPFVLSMDGIYNYTLNGHSVINLPIAPNVTVS